MEKWIEDLHKKYAAPSKKVVAPDRKKFNTPAPRQAADVKEQCKLCQIGGRLHCKGRDRNCGCRWCTGDGRD